MPFSHGFARLVLPTSALTLMPGDEFAAVRKRALAATGP